MLAKFAKFEIFAKLLNLARIAKFAKMKKFAKSFRLARFGKVF